MTPLRTVPLLLACGAALSAVVLRPATGLEPPAGVQQWEVAEGTAGLLVEDHRVPLVALELELAAGSWSGWVREQEADTAFAIQLYDSRGELRRRADLVAATVTLEVEQLSSVLSLTCRKEDLESALDLVRSILANRDFDRAELRRRRKSARLSWQGSLREPRFVLSQTAAQVLYRTGDARRIPFEPPRSPKANPERLAVARDALLCLPGRVVGLAGDVTLDEARRLATGLLPPVSNHLPQNLTPALGPLTPAEFRPAEKQVTLPRLTQVYFAYCRDSLRYTDPDYPASMIADHALGGHFNSRLMVALRHQSGSTYGAGVRSTGGVDRGVYGLETFTCTDNAGATESELRQVLELFHEHGIREEERVLAVGNVVGRRAFGRQSPQQILLTAMRERRLGLPYGFFDRQAERAAALSLDAVNAFIRRFHDPRKFTMLKLRAE